MSNNDSESLFLKALDRCQLLPSYERKPSPCACEAIHLLCQVAGEPEQLLQLLKKYSREVNQADQLVTHYATTIDNWQVEDCPLGSREHCNILHFFLNLHNSYQEQLFFRGKDFTPELICEFLQDWKGINLFPWIVSSPQLLTHSI